MSAVPSLTGSRNWSERAPLVGNHTILSDAVALIASFSTDSTTLQRTQRLDELAPLYFSSMPFDRLGDLIGATAILLQTPNLLTHPATRPLAGLVQPGWRTEAGVRAAMSLLRDDLLDEQLRRVWRSPEAFPAQREFDAELGRRAMHLSLPATEWSGELSAEVVEAALHRLLDDWNALKWDRRGTLSLIGEVLEAKNTPLTRRARRTWSKEFRRGRWEQSFRAIYEEHGSCLTVQLHHIVQYGQRMKWVGVSMPHFDGSRPARSL